MSEVLTAVATAFEEQFEDGLPVLEAHNVTLAVLLMHVACRPHLPLHRLLAATWPPIDATLGLPVCWDEAQIARLKGTSLAEATRALQSDVSPRRQHEDDSIA